MAMASISDYKGNIHNFSIHSQGNEISIFHSCDNVFGKYTFRQYTKTTLFQGTWNVKWNEYTGRFDFFVVTASDTEDIKVTIAPDGVVETRNDDPHCQ